MCRRHTSLLVIKRWHGALGTQRRSVMMNVKSIRNGSRVIIPSEVWEALQDLAEGIEIY